MMFCKTISSKSTLHVGKIIVSKGINIQKNVLRLCNTTVENLSKWSQLKSKYSESQQSSVLDILKKCSTTEMKKYGISEVFIKSLKSSLDGKKFTSLDDFISFDLLKVNELDRICAAIAAKKSKVTKKANIVTRAIKKEELKNINTAVGLRIAPNHVSWSQLAITGSNCDVLNLHCRMIVDLPLNANPIEMVQGALDIAKTIPDADAYIMEKELAKSAAKLNVALVRLMMRQQQILSVILTYLMTKKSTDSEQKVDDLFYILKPNATAKNFDLFFGHETVSTNDVVQALFQQRDAGLKNISCLTVNDEIEKYHSLLDHFSKEELNKCLLLTLTFFDSAVLCST